MFKNFCPSLYDKHLVAHVSMQPFNTAFNILGAGYLLKKSDNNVFGRMEEWIVASTV